MTATDKPARRTVSAEEKAREALGVIDRRVQALESRRDKINARGKAITEKYEDEIASVGAALAFVEDELAAAVKRRDYLAGDPALPKTPRPVVSEPTTTVPGGTA